MSDEFDGFCLLERFYSDQIVSVMLLVIFAHFCILLGLDHLLSDNIHYGSVNAVFAVHIWILNYDTFDTKECDILHGNISFLSDIFCYCARFWCLS